MAKAIAPTVAAVAAEESVIFFFKKNRVYTQSQWPYDEKPTWHLNILKQSAKSRNSTYKHTPTDPNSKSTFCFHLKQLNRVEWNTISKYKFIYIEIKQFVSNSVMLLSLWSSKVLVLQTKWRALWRSLTHF